MRESEKTIDKILEILFDREYIGINELEKELKISDISYLCYFMKEAGLIEVKDHYVRITEPALQILVAELFPWLS